MHVLLFMRFSIIHSHWILFLKHPNVNYHDNDFELIQNHAFNSNKKLND